MATENSMLQSENTKLRQRIKVMQEAVEEVKARNAQLLADTALATLGVGGNS